MTRAPHLAFVLTRSDLLGGAQVHIRDLGVALSARGYRVSVLVGGEGAYLDDLRAADLATIPLPDLQRDPHPPRDLRALAALRQTFRRLAPDLISLHTAKAGALGRIAALGLHIPILYTPHGLSFRDPNDGRGPLYARLERLLAPATDRFVHVCAADRRDALAARIGRAAQHVVIHNGMPDIPAAQRADPRRAPPKMVMVARFEGAKDHPTLIAALQRLPRELPWSLELIGAGERLGGVRAQVDALGLSPRVSFAGAVRDVADRLAQAQLLVLTSDAEGFPRSILEGMRAGLPVVASAVNGVPEQVSDQVSGLLVPPRDPAATAAALTALLCDPDRRATFGSAGRAHFERAFTFERMLEETCALYQTLLPRHAANARASGRRSGKAGPSDGGSPPERASP